jgi:hypothetical protein
MIPETDLNNLRSTMDRKLSETSKHNQELAARNQALEQAVLNMRWQQMEQTDPDAVQRERGEYAQYVRQRADAEAATQLQGAYTALNEMAKPLVAIKLAEHYGLPSDPDVIGSLMEFGDRPSMEAHARTLSKVLGRQTLQSRKESGTDRMDGNGSADTTAAWSKLSPGDKIEWALAHPSHRR